MRVIWSSKAKERLAEILEQGSVNFGRSVSLELYRRVKYFSSLLKTNPMMGKLDSLLESVPLSIRTIVVHDYFEIVYYVDEVENCIYILTLWDTRRDPDEYVNDLFHEKID
ncbi:type II toxin-antitoxin system RelE/ParE family toxin [Butyricimonas sp.]|uniref:type II toxin-antitoxin system RelE/ParE family toxin n=1 Tax=Butyricimonas sp. TaxID=1969738 RepID=UPI0025BAC66B|nr:type II toxin-antitoxin system RelE/ParE family toxin [Butyricimonas sp.]